MVTSAQLHQLRQRMSHAMDELLGFGMGEPEDCFHLLEQVPCEERRRLLGVLRDALAEAKTNPPNGLAMLDLALAWAETADQDEPGHEPLIHCYRMAIHLYCRRFITPTEDADMRYYHSAVLDH